LSYGRPGSVRLPQTLQKCKVTRQLQPPHRSSRGDETVKAAVLNGASRRLLVDRGSGGESDPAGLARTHTDLPPAGTLPSARDNRSDLPAPREFPPVARIEDDRVRVRSGEKWWPPPEKTAVAARSNLPRPLSRPFPLAPRYAPGAASSASRRAAQHGGSDRVRWPCAIDNL